MSVFQCGNCKLDYNQSINLITILKANKLPLSLPCGHVYCEECMYTFLIPPLHTSEDNKKSNNITDEKSLKCPFDKKILKFTEMSKIPKCYQILLNLPSKNSNTTNNSGNAPTNATNINNQNKHNIINCNRHVNKKIKYFCQTDKSFPCSICVKEHQDSNHELESFEISFEKMLNEWNNLKKMIDFEYIEVFLLLY